MNKQLKACTVDSNNFHSTSYNNVNTVVIKSDGEERGGTQKIIIKSGGGDHEVYEISTSGDDNAIWFSDDCDLHRLDKNVKVELEDGKKKVPVTTTENGEEKTEVYDILIEIDQDGNYNKVKKIIIEIEETKVKSK